MQQNGNQAIYYYSNTGCCAQGIPFDINNQYCCYDGIHNYADGFCGSFNPKASNPSCYNCKTSSQYLMTTKDFEAIAMKNGNNSTSTSTVPIDTSITNTENPCYTADSTYGCLNLYSFDFKTTYPCGKYLLNVDEFGCCNGFFYLLFYIFIFTVYLYYYC
jgi:hypothetical protein